MMAETDSSGCSAAFTGSTKMLHVYHQLVQPCTTLLETHFSIPSDVAPMLSMCVGVFVPLYLLGAVVFASLRFSGCVRWEMSSVVPSLLHGVVSSIVGFLLLSDHWSEHGTLVADTTNTPKDTALLQFSCAYFIHDLFIYVGIFAPHERLFAMHHVGVLAYMLITMYLGYGNITAVLAIFMGEITSPIQNVWFWLKHLRYRYKVADQLFAYVSWMYSAFYIFIRSGVGLYMVLYTAYKVLHAPKFPEGIRNFMVFLLVGGCLASQLWCYKLSSRLRTKYRPAYRRIQAPHAPAGLPGAKDAPNGHNGTAANGDGLLHSSEQKTR
eukprot:jgi/Ulvmu1/12547/UM090_0034.1